MRDHDAITRRQREEHEKTRELLDQALAIVGQQRSEIEKWQAMFRDLMATNKSLEILVEQLSGDLRSVTATARAQLRGTKS